MTRALVGLGCFIFIDTHCKPNKSLALCQQPNKFLVPLPRILTVFGVWIDILAKVKLANLRKKKKKLAIFYFENIAYLFSYFHLLLICS